MARAKTWFETSVLLWVAACSNAAGGAGAAGAGAPPAANANAGAAGANAAVAGRAAVAGAPSTNGAAGSSGAPSAGSGAGGAGAGPVAMMGPDAGSGAAPGAPDGGAALAFDAAKAAIDAYKAAHPGNGGQDADVTAKSPAELAADPDAQALVALCGADRLPVIPSLVWEYGGNDHAWLNPMASALVYCVYIPVSPSSDHFRYDASADHVTADVYVLYPDQNPCKAEQGADQVAKCIGDQTNFEILVDIASLNDGADAGLSLSEASTELRLILPDGTTVHLIDNQ